MSKFISEPPVDIAVFDCADALEAFNGRCDNGSARVILACGAMGELLAVTPRGVLFGAEREAAKRKQALVMSDFDLTFAPWCKVSKITAPGES